MTEDLVLKKLIANAKNDINGLETLKKYLDIQYSECSDQKKSKDPVLDWLINNINEGKDPEGIKKLKEYLYIEHTKFTEEPKFPRVNVVNKSNVKDGYRGK